MNRHTSFLNECSRPAIDFAGAMLWQTSLLIGALLLFDLLFGRRTRAALRYALWLLVLIKLTLPPTLAIPTGLGYWLAPFGPSQPLSSQADPAAIVGVSEIPGDLAPTSGPTDLRPRVSGDSLLLVGWFAGSGLLLGLLVRRSRQAARLVREAAPAPPALQRLLNECRARLRVRARVGLRVSPAAISPAVCGWRSPVVLLPRLLAERLPLDQHRDIVLHELAHVKRRDVWVNGLQSLLQVVYWWHPLIWLANARIQRAREEAVDESIMVALEDRRDTYPSTLLEAAKLACTRPLNAMGFVGVFESRSVLDRRIRRLLELPTGRSAKLGLSGMAVVVASALLLLPMARGQNTSGSESPTAVDEPPTAAAEAPVVTLTCRFLHTSGEALQRIDLGPPSAVGTNRHRVWVLSPGPFREVLERLAREPNGGGVIVLNPDLAPERGAHVLPVVSSSVVSEQELEPKGAPSEAPVGAVIMTLKQPMPDGHIIDPVTGQALILPGPEFPGFDLMVGVTETPPFYSFRAAPITLQELAQVLEREAKKGKDRPLRIQAARDVPAARINELLEAARAAGIEKATLMPQLETRIFKVDPATFLGDLIAGPSGLTKSEAVRAFFAAAGVSVEPPNQIYYNDRKGFLMIRATPDELSRLEEAIAAGENKSASQDATGSPGARPHGS